MLVKLVSVEIGILAFGVAMEDMDTPLRTQGVKSRELSGEALSGLVCERSQSSPAQLRAERAGEAVRPREGGESLGQRGEVKALAREKGRRTLRSSGQLFPCPGRQVQSLCLCLCLCSCEIWCNSMSSPDSDQHCPLQHHAARERGRQKW